MDSKLNPVVHVVHCVDTEGPLFESLEATFGRLYELYGLRVHPSQENLEKLQKGNHPDVPDKLAGGIAATFSEANLSYNSSWTEVDAMLNEATSERFRNVFEDSFGDGWKYSWFVLDHVHVGQNLRRKAEGWMAVFNHYWEKLDGFGSGDEFQYHFHPTSISNNYLAPATSYINTSSDFMEGLARRLIDHSHFPSVFRPGFHSIRPDSNALLELWFPFDFSNQSVSSATREPDEMHGRFGDWNRAPATWRGFHPSLRDYQLEGELRRRTFRCLNVGTRMRQLTRDHVFEAFEEARRFGNSVLAFADHDFRDIRPDVERVHGWLVEAQQSYPEIFFRNNTAQRAAMAMGQTWHRNCQLQVSWAGHLMRVQVSGYMFSAQPFLAIKTCDGRYLHDNLDKGAKENEWTYTFDDYTLNTSQVSKIGLAAVAENGEVSTVIIDFDLEK